MSLLTAVIMPGHRRISSQVAVAQFSHWRYKQIAASDDTDYSSPGYDDSGWAVGPAPFGDWEDGHDVGYDAPPAFDPRFARDFATTWAANTRLWMRRTLTVAAVPAGGYLMTSFIEDNCHAYINGVLVLDSPDNPPVVSGYRTAIPASVFVVGVNHLAVRCDDEPANSSISVTYADFLLDPLY